MDQHTRQSQPCIITAAITGSVPRKEDNPAVPITVSEQIEATHAAFEAAPRAEPLANCLRGVCATLHLATAFRVLKPLVARARTAGVARAAGRAGAEDTTGTGSSLNCLIA